jgi:predicted metal-dependent hydrolase
MRSYQLEIDGIAIDVHHKPIKNMNLRIYPPDGQVRVSAPLQLSTQHIKQQLEAKREWLHAQRAKLQTRPHQLAPIFEQGETHYFLGQAYSLDILDSPYRIDVRINNKTLELKIPPHADLTKKQSALKRWYQQQMHALIPPLIQHWEPLIGVTVKDWVIKSMKTRWGSCNIRTGSICLNLTLIHKPLICMEYVLVHEMVHLLEASHNSRFYKLMDTFMPEWRDHEKKLYLMR